MSGCQRGKKRRQALALFREMLSQGIQAIVTIRRPLGPGARCGEWQPLGQRARVGRDVQLGYGARRGRETLSGIEPDAAESARLYGGSWRGY